MRLGVLKAQLLLYLFDPSAMLNMNEENVKEVPCLRDQSSGSSDVKLEICRPKKAINLLYAISMTIGTVIGCGIFITVKESFTVFQSTPIGMVDVFWISGGIVSILGAFCYVELATRMPESGGDRVYFKQLISQKFSRVFVLFFVFVIKSLLMAALAITTAKNLVSAFSSSHAASLIWLEQILALATISLCLFINCIGKELAVRAGFALTILKILAVLIITGGGIYFALRGEAEEWRNPFYMTGLSLPGLADCLIGIIWAYDGSNTIALIAGDMERPSRNLPLAIIIGFPIVIVLYVLAVTSYSAILDYNVARESTTIAISAAKRFLGKGTPVIAVLICCSATGAANGLLYALSCVSVSAGCSGELPKIFSLVQRRTRTPIFSIVAISLVSCLFTFLDFDRILRCCTFLTWIFYFASYYCLWKIKLQTRGQSLPGVFNVPYLLIIPIQIACIFVVSMSFYRDPIGCSIFAAVFLVGLALQYISFPFLCPFKHSQLQERIICYLCRTFYLEPARSQDIS